MSLPETVPLYPLAPLVFLAAAVLFALQMARHLRVFAVAPAGGRDGPARSPAWARWSGSRWCRCACSATRSRA